jgi:hypothetical protein
MAAKLIHVFSESIENRHFNKPLILEIIIRVPGL